MNKVESTKSVLADNYTLRIVSLSLICCNAHLISIKRLLTAFHHFVENRLKFLKHQESRKRLKNGIGTYSRVWILYVLDDKNNGKVKVLRIEFRIHFLFICRKCHQEHFCTYGDP